MKRECCLFITTCFLLSFILTPVFEEIGVENDAKSSLSQGYAPHSVDEFESINATDQSYVTSMDTLSGQMAGCAVFSGTFSNSNLGAASVQSSGSMDILLFGWSSTSGYWHTTVGGDSNDLCWKVKWINDHLVGVSGYFESAISFGAEQHFSEGSKDGFFAVYNTTSSQWQTSISLGTSGLEEIRSFVPLSNGTFALVASSNGNLTGTGISGAPACDKYAPIATICSILMYVNNDLVPLSISSLHSTGSVVGYDAIEVGTTGKIILVGHFTKTLLYDGGNISVQGTSYTDVFVARFSQQGTNDLMSAFGGEGVDEARSIINTPTGFVVAGATESSPSSQSQVYEPTLGWQAPLGNGGKDILMLQITPSGLITDGFTFGTNQSDSVGEHSIDETGLIYMSGYIGGTMQHPILNATMGVENERSAYVAIVNMSGGSTSHLVDLYASFGSSNSDARANTVSVTTSDEVWIGGRLSPGAQSNTFFGQEAKGFDKGGYILRIGSDLDIDNRPLRTDNCPETFNPQQLDYDQDNQGDACDLDDDNDGIPDLGDMLCPLSNPYGFVSNFETDHDGDGCADLSEDADDDNDGYLDVDEADTDCPAGYINWEAGNTTIDRDRDGCHDMEEDLDDDGDGFIDTEDNCALPTSTVFNATTWVDFDLDGCHDEEDPDLDNDGIFNNLDLCDDSPPNWLSIPSEDYDLDGCKDDIEDDDDDNDNVEDILDLECPLSLTKGFVSTSANDYDSDGCQDTVEDNDNDNDGILNEIDIKCEKSEDLGWISNELTDRDGDGCRDHGEQNGGFGEDTDDDNDGVHDENDICNDANFETNWTSNELSDYNSNGCRDDGVQNGGYGEDIDDDSDGINDALDLVCPKSPLLLSGDLDGDGCKDDEENEVDIDGDGIPNIPDNDNCPEGSQILVDDIDDDGCNNNEDPDDDGDGIEDEVDACDIDSPEFFKDYVNWAAKDNFELDYDQDGCHDEGEDPDDDNDGVLDTKDQCDPPQYSKKNWPAKDNFALDYDQDGCHDEGEDSDDDNDGVNDTKDQCDPESMTSDQDGWIPEPGQDKNGDGCVDDLALTNADQKAASLELLGLGATGILVLVVLVRVGRKKEITNNQTNIFGNASEQNKTEPESDQTAELEEEPESTTVTQLMQYFGGYGGPYEVEWLVEVGDTIQKGQVIVEVTTDSGTYNLESEFNGVIIKSYGGWRDNLEVGDPVMDLEPVK